MIDYIALMKAQSAAPHATPPARMVGGDKPKWDAKMDWEVFHIYSNPHYISPHTIIGADPNDDAPVIRVSVSGTIEDQDVGNPFGGE